MTHFEKDLAIVNCIVGAAERLIKLAEAVPYSRRKVFHRRDRRLVRLRRQEVKAHFAYIAMVTYMEQVQLALIISQPIPKSVVN